ncbi:AAA family ATPase, partial [bacterium]|nr:AAA family ATPase [bacterium]
MLTAQILSYLSENSRAKANEIAKAIGKVTDSEPTQFRINSALAELEKTGFAKLNDFDFTWMLTEAGILHARKQSNPDRLGKTTQPKTLKSSKENQEIQIESPANQELSSNVSKMFGFLEEWYKMDLKPFSNIGLDSRVKWCELTNLAIRELPGILVGDEIADKSCWLSIERLKPISPPDLPEILDEWTSVTNDPSKQPEIETEIYVVDKDATEIVLEQHRKEQLRITNLPEDHPEKGEALDSPGDVVIKIFLVDQLEIQTAWDDYHSSWKDWASEEIIRRKTIALYKALFSYRQQLENSTDSSPQELVWGVGMTYLSGKESLRFPLLSIPIEFIGNTDDLTIKIAGLDRPPYCNISAFLNDYPEGAAAFEKFIRTEFAPDPEKESLTPFDFERLQQILTIDAGRIDSSTTFTETRPQKADVITFTLDWVIMIQTRSSNYMLQDVQKLKELAEKEEFLQSALDDISIRREEPYPESQDIFRGFSHVESDPDLNGPSRSLYFPKPYNQEQVEVIRKLENSEGVVLQGPPGTGKTHTIANIISHYLATGKRVLVTSDKSPALRVLKSQLPDGIQMLTGLLLDNDRQGQAELESGVHRITAEILQLNPSSLKREIESLEEAIQRGHDELLLNEKKTNTLANQYRTAPPEHIGCESPRQLAEEVLDCEELYSNFPDELDPERGWKESPIDSAFFEELRTARKAAGEHLEADPETILNASVLPTVEECANLHKSLGCYSTSREALNNLSEYPASKYLQNNERLNASQIVTDLEGKKEAIKFSSQGEWQKTVFDCYHNPAELSDNLTGIEKSLRDSINECIKKCRKNDQEVKQFSLKPVQLPDG